MPPRQHSPPRAFTLVELLVSMAVFLVLVSLLLGIVNQSSAVWRREQAEADSYESARLGFNLITRTLSQSRMKVYNGYDNEANPGVAPTRYVRRSDLNLVIASVQGNDYHQGNSVFFQAPLGRTADPATYGGLPGLLNSVGYYVTYGKDPNLPAFLQTYDRYRFRLMQFVAPAENMTVYKNGSNRGWFTTDLATDSEVVADNVILALFWPRLSEREDATGNALTSDYTYDSRTGATNTPQPLTANQQPPLVQVTLVVVDEASTVRFPNAATPPDAIVSCTAGLFKSSKADDYQQDLATLEARLTAARIGYRIFSSAVPLRETKWQESNP